MVEKAWFLLEPCFLPASQALSQENRKEKRLLGQEFSFSFRPAQIINPQPIKAPTHPCSTNHSLLESSWPQLGGSSSIPLTAQVKLFLLGEAFSWVLVILCWTFGCSHCATSLFLARACSGLPLQGCQRALGIVHTYLLASID